MQNRRAKASEGKGVLVAAVLALGMVLLPVVSVAQDFEGMLDDDPLAGLSLVEVDSLDSPPEFGADPFAGFSPIDEAELDAARGRAVLPDGLTLEATGLMRVLVEGQELAHSVVLDGASFAPGQAPQIPFSGAPVVFENTMNGISLEHYREINFRISNVPIALEMPRFVPPPVISTDVLP